MPDEVADDTKNERSQVLRAEAATGVDRLVSRHLGSLAAVAGESETEGICRGLTDTNVRAYGVEVKATVGRLTSVELRHRFRDGVWASPAGVQIPLMALTR